MPKPYVTRSGIAGHKSFEVLFSVTYTKVESIYRALSTLYRTSMEASGFHYEQDLDEIFFKNPDLFSNTVFDKTRIKSLSEKPLLQKEFIVK